MGRPEPEIRPLGPADDLGAQLDLGARAFGTASPARAERLRQVLSLLIEQGNVLGAFCGGRAAGSAAFHDTRQWWHGRAVPMAAVSSVKVAPEDRGRGIGRALMTALLRQIAGRGYPLSALYPATMPLYRSLGWELAGGMYTAVIPARSLRVPAPPDVPAAALTSGMPADGPALRRAGPGDAGAVVSVRSQAHEAARDCGPLTWDAATLRLWLADQDLYAYLCDDGFLAYRWEDGNQAIAVMAAQGTSAGTVRALWAHVASYGSVAEKVYARVGPADALWWLGREPDADVAHREMWMLRVVDAPAAIAARGFPAAVSLTVPLAIADAALPGNAGRWRLAVADGKGSLTRQGAAAAQLELGARGLAALYAGTPVTTLRQAGLASGGRPDDDAALDAAFAAAPYMLDTF
ncbi:MAG: GNAT family N-acetyltransferase [Streptosporangiaceae bacterium]|nr:GNAT family N-acetyltransferase [Streptosporangiaceae bacterium]